MTVWTTFRSLVGGRFGAGELRLLLSVLVPALLLYAFVQIAGEVREGESKAFDEALLRALRNPADLADPIGPRWVEAMMKDITSLGSTTVLTFLTVVVVVYLLMARKRAAALLVAGAVAGGTIASSLLKIGFARPRPDLVAHSVDVMTLSFPSGHAMLSAATYLTLGALLARIEPHWRLKSYILGVAIVLTLAIGVSRVYLGVHYPTDVLAGWAAGAFWASLCWLLARWLQREGAVESDGSSPARSAAPRAPAETNPP